MKLTFASMLGGVALLGAGTFFLGTKAKPRPTPAVAAIEVAAPIAMHVAATSTSPSVAAPTFAALQAEAPSPAAPTAAVVATAPEPPQVDSSSEEHPGRTKELAQTPAWKAEKTHAILQVVSSRVERVEKEAAELERAGDAEAAASKRVLLARLKRQISTMNDEIVAYAKAEPAEPR